MVILGYEEKGSSFKQCTHLVSTSTSLSYCINYHEWMTTCPSKCPYFKEGRSVDIKDLRNKKFNPECYYFAISDINDSLYQCKLFKQENPICESCQYLKLTDGNKDTS